MLNKRVISAIISLPLLFFVVIFNDHVFLAGLCIVALMGLYEYFLAVSAIKIRPMKILGSVCGIILILIMAHERAFEYMAPFITLVIFLLLSTTVFFRKYNFLGAGATVIGMYIPFFFGYIQLIRAIPERGIYLVWFVFIVSWITDTAAYFSGMAFGKTKLCPSISPKKTVEGAIGGIIASIIACVGYGLFLGSRGIIEIPLYKLLILGALGSLVSQLGDLAASSIKRKVGIKDYGSIMPGHGGVMDRFDSILFAAPLIYYYIIYFLL